MKKFLFALICLTFGAAFATGATSEEAEVPLKEKWARLVKDLTVQIDELKKSQVRVNDDIKFVRDLGVKKGNLYDFGSKEYKLYETLLIQSGDYDKQIAILENELRKAKIEANK